MHARASWEACGIVADKDSETRVFLKEVLDEFWKSESVPDGDIPTGPAPAVEPTLALWREKQWPVSYLQANPKRAPR